MNGVGVGGDGDGTGPNCIFKDLPLFRDTEVYFYTRIIYGNVRNF